MKRTINSVPHEAIRILEREIAELQSFLDDLKQLDDPNETCTCTGYDLCHFCLAENRVKNFAQTGVSTEIARAEELVRNEFQPRDCLKHEAIEVNDPVPF